MHTGSSILASELCFIDLTSPTLPYIKEITIITIFELCLPWIPTNRGIKF
jgi:hypothetical protein